MVGAGHAPCVPGNHENKLVRALPGRQRHGQPRARADAGPARRRGRRVPYCSSRVLRRPGLPPGARRRPAGRRARRPQGGLPRAGVGAGAIVRALRRHHRRDRRVRACPCGCPGPTTTAAGRWCSTGTRRRSSRSGSTTRMCLDTGCVFGGQLTALRYPEKEVVSVPAEQVWYEPAKPLPRRRTPVRQPDDLAITDVLGKRGVETRLAGRVTVREENAAGALEVMSRFALEPRGCSTCRRRWHRARTSPDGDLLEHPRGGLRRLPRRVACGEVICEEKHMGSRAVALVCRSATWPTGGSAPPTGGAAPSTPAPVGRSSTARLTESLLLTARGRRSTAAGLWAELDTDWLLLDCELLPWSAKAEELLRDAVRRGRRGGSGCTAGCRSRSWRRPRARRRRRRAARPYARLGRPTQRLSRDAYRRYVWPTDGLDGVQLAPFQLLATEGRPGRTATTAGTSSWRTGWSRPTPSWSGRPAGSSSTWPTTPRSRPAWSGGRSSPRPAARAWWSSRWPTWCGPARAGRSRASRSAAGSTCGSSTAPTTPSRPTSSGCAPRNLGHKRSLAAREYALGHRVARACRRGRAAVAGARAGVRRARAGVRAGRPSTVTGGVQNPMASRSSRTVLRPGRGSALRISRWLTALGHPWAASVRALSSGRQCSSTRRRAVLEVGDHLLRADDPDPAAGAAGVGGQLAAAAGGDHQ